jgi:hypothetical protein
VHLFLPAESTQGCYAAEMDPDRDPTISFRSKTVSNIFKIDLGRTNFACQQVFIRTNRRLLGDYSDTTEPLCYFCATMTKTPLGAGAASVADPTFARIRQLEQSKRSVLAA